jgi:hypothetical protein
VLSCPPTASGASERIGFIDAPVTGAPHTATIPMYPPIAIAALGPMFRAPDEVPRITLERNAAGRTADERPAVCPPTHRNAIRRPIDRPDCPAQLEKSFRRHFSHSRLSDATMAC